MSSRFFHVNTFGLISFLLNSCIVLLTMVTSNLFNLSSINDYLFSYLIFKRMKQSSVVFMYFYARMHIFLKNRITEIEMRSQKADKQCCLPKIFHKFICLQNVRDVIISYPHQHLMLSIILIVLNQWVKICIYWMYFSLLVVSLSTIKILWNDYIFYVLVWLYTWMGVCACEWVQTWNKIQQNITGNY